MAAELVPIANDASLLTRDWQSEVLRVRKAVEVMNAPEDLKEMNDRARALGAYAEAKRAFDAMQAASEICVWIERHAGAIRASLRSAGEDTTALDRQLFVPERRNAYGNESYPGESAARLELGRWERLARVPEEVVEQVIAELREHRRRISGRTVVTEANYIQSTEVKKDIFLRPDGHYRIRWRVTSGRYKGRWSSEVVFTSNIGAAERRLRWRKAGSPVEKTGSAARAGLDGAYADLRRLMQTLDQLLPHLDGESRRHVAASLDYLGRAEDTLSEGRIASSLRERS